ncbi:AI-2E family transporter [Mesorhizobium captivum]|uniref:AI-2E family transporter n=1 Tax=Mesorhizobium captivum TaxID=3072319 RepID=A0ABU4ZAE4_9HYPH|nr:MULTISPECIES: AI-2E family transporter [unclassified Mesorhizobium]MDX8446582.1 AI-2E family transporter [Mesorhizobium sp. VK3C]MDX8496234.1 AI-2E family transporter [Mesorhizobium sp. VK22B]MDX8509610.1 AI-2E family transporter [Mesorhizobium sp. VK22E]
MKRAEIQKPGQRLFGLSTPLRAAVIPPLSAARWLLVLIVAAGVYFFHGFLFPVLAALVIAFASWPLYRRLLAAVGGNRTIAATLAILFILTFLVVPIALAGTYAINELREWVVWAIETNRHGSATPQWIATMPVIGEWLNQQWAANLGHPGGIGELIQMVSGSNIGTIYRGALAAGGSAFGLLLTLLFMLIALFFAYRDGESFAAQVDRLGERILPTRWERISRVVPATISSTVTGMTVIAIGEGLVLGVAYWLAGVPSPVTLGALTGIMALIPGGAPLSFTLVSIYLAASGKLFAGMALFIWGAVELFIVDKTLRPKLVGGPIKLPFLPTFFGLIGGVKTMGFLGLFIGPVLMALLVAIWREWLREVEIMDEQAPATDEGNEPPRIEATPETRKIQAG